MLIKWVILQRGSLVIIADQASVDQGQAGPEDGDVIECTTVGAHE